MTEGLIDFKLINVLMNLDLIIVSFKQDVYNVEQTQFN